MVDLNAAAEHKQKQLDEIHQQISLIYSKILSLDLTPDDLSKPTTSKKIPWPSPLPSPCDRFATSSKDDVTNFQYMGRSMFKGVLKEITDSWADKPYSRLYLYGPSGVGKSHLLATVVLCLTRQGKRVVYIPDCRDALKTPFHYIQTALLYAFHNDNDSCDTIAAAMQVDDLIRFMNGRPNESTYIIVDQVNALELDGGDDPAADQKRMVRRTVEGMGFSQKYIFSASAGDKSHRRVDEKQTGTNVFYINTGMTKVCPHFFELPCLTFPRLRRTPGSNATHPGSPKHTASLSRT